MNTDPKTYRAGTIHNFEAKLPSLLIWADLLIESDEIEKAEWLLTKGMPAYYRDNPPPRVREKLKQLHQYMMNVADYAANPNDLELINPERSASIVMTTMRGQLLKDSVDKLNSENIIPVLYEMGPGEFWIPIGLKQLGCKFKYGASYLSSKAADVARDILKDEWLTEIPHDCYQIFVACEIIEHLSREVDIVQTMHKSGWDRPNEVHLSTPLYTFGGGIPNWDSNGMRGLGGHLRTYTPGEFMGVAAAMFPGYHWSYSSNEIQSLVGRSK